MSTHSIGVSLVVVNQNKLLVGQRGPACRNGNGFFAFPGGSLNCGSRETIEEAALRETKEETGRTYTLGYRPVQFATFTQLDGQHWLTYFLRADTDSGLEPILGREPEKCMLWIWKTIDELDRLVEQSKNPFEARKWIPVSSLREKLFSAI